VTMHTVCYLASTSLMASNFLPSVDNFAFNQRKT